MTHHVLFSGDGYYCPKCSCSWDQDELPPEHCRTRTSAMAPDRKRKSRVSEQKVNKAIALR